MPANFEEHIVAAPNNVAGDRQQIVVVGNEIVSVVISRTRKVQSVWRLQIVGPAQPASEFADLSIYLDQRQARRVENAVEMVWIWPRPRGTLLRPK